MRKIAILFLLTLFTILLYRTFIVFPPDKAIFEPCSSSDNHHALMFDKKRLKLFQTLLRFQTVSYDQLNQNTTELARCRDFIKNTYGNILKNHGSYVQLVDIAQYSLLYVVRGKNQNLKPFLFSSHIDVVPANHIERWTYPPFEAQYDDEFIFARGVLDDK